MQAPARHDQRIETAALQRCIRAPLQRGEVVGIECGKIGTHGGRSVVRWGCQHSAPTQARRRAYSNWPPGPSIHSRSWRMCSSGTVMKRKPLQRWPEAWAASCHSRCAPTSIGGLAALRIVEVEAELVQRVLDHRGVGHQQHAGLRQVAQAADDARRPSCPPRSPCRRPCGARRGGIRRSCVCPPVSAVSLLPAKLRSALSAACQARSTRRPLSAVTTCACPIAIMRARLSSDCSPTRWPRWFTNSALSVIGLNHDRRRRTRSPCWLLTNSNHVPKGRVRRCS